MNPGQPINEDITKMDETRLQELGISWLPRNLHQAITCLAEDTVLASTIGRSIWEEFIKIKRTEWELELFAKRF